MSIPLHHCWRVVVIVGIFSQATGFAESPQSDPLPTWREGESLAAWQADGWMAGWDLLGKHPELEAEVHPDAKLPEPPAGSLPEPPPTTELVPDKWANAYFEKPSEKHLIDPQSLLTESQREQLTQILVSHSEESAVAVRVFLFGGRQEIPGEWRVEEQAERLDIPSKPAVMLIYYLGAPHRCEMYLPPALGTHISISEQRRTQESCLLQAQAKVDPVEQLEACLQQLSIRAYWIGHTCGLERAQEGLSQTIPEKSHPKKSGKSSPKWNLPPAVMEAVTKYQPYWPWLAGAMAVLLSTLACTCWWLVRRKRKFPILQIEPRLGGHHAAGVGAAISFANAQKSPSTQRVNPPDLR